MAGHAAGVGDVAHIGIEEIEVLQGFERVGMRRAAAALGVSSLGISIEELGPGADEYPEHDHSEDGFELAVLATQAA